MYLIHEKQGNTRAVANNVFLFFLLFCFAKPFVKFQFSKRAGSKSFTFLVICKSGLISLRNW